MTTTHMKKTYEICERCEGYGLIRYDHSFEHECVCPICDGHGRIVTGYTYTLLSARQRATQQALSYASTVGLITFAAVLAMTIFYGALWLVGEIAELVL